MFICRNYSKIKRFFKECIARLCCAQPGIACLFKGCKSLQLRRGSHVTEKSLLPPFSPVIPFLTWANPTHPGFRDNHCLYQGNRKAPSFQYSKTTMLHLPASLTRIASSFLSIQDSKLVSPQRTRLSACWALLGPAVWLLTITWVLLLVRNKKAPMKCCREGQTKNMANYHHL